MLGFSYEKCEGRSSAINFQLEASLIWILWMLLMLPNPSHSQHRFQVSNTKCFQRFQGFLKRHEAVRLSIGTDPSDRIEVSNNAEVFWISLAYSPELVRQILGALKPSNLSFLGQLGSSGPRERNPNMLRFRFGLFCKVLCHCPQLNRWEPWPQPHRFPHRLALQSLGGREWGGATSSDKTRNPN